jgi:hypothetical protein
MCTYLHGISPAVASRRRYKHPELFGELILLRLAAFSLHDEGIERGTLQSSESSATSRRWELDAGYLR